MFLLYIWSNKCSLGEHKILILKTFKITDKTFERKLFCSHCNYLFIHLKYLQYKQYFSTNCHGKGKPINPLFLNHGKSTVDFYTELIYAQL